VHASLDEEAGQFSRQVSGIIGIVPRIAARVADPVAAFGATRGDGGDGVAHTARVIDIVDCDRHSLFCTAGSTD